MRERAITMVRTHGDTALAVALVCLVVAQIWGTDASAAMRGAASAGFLVLVVPLARRRAMPVLLLALLVVLAAAGSSLPRPILDVEAVGLILLLSIYNGAAHTSGRRTAAAAALTVALGLGALLGDPQGVYLGGVIFFGLLLGAPWITGRVVRRRRQNEARLERERDDAMAAVADERARIARELHDVVAHAISVIVLQARGGRRLLDSDPEETRGALTTIEGTARQALGEMRRLVGLLREDDATVALVPQPSLAGLDGLLADVRAAGLPVDVAVEGEPVDLPPGVQPVGLSHRSGGARPTPSSTPAPRGPACCCATRARVSPSRSTTTASGRARPQTVGTAWRASASGWASTAASWMRGRGSMAATQ